MESVSFKLPPHLVSRLHALAESEDVTVGQILRSAVEREFRRRDSLDTHPRAERDLLEPLRLHLTRDFETAKSWSDLRERLLNAGYLLREAGGGLALHEAVTGKFLCRTSELGFGYPTLLRRFKTPFPGHSHTWLLDRIRDIPVYARN